MGPDRPVLPLELLTNGLLKNMRPNFFKEITTERKTVDLRESLISLIQEVMDDKNTTDEERHTLARLRAYIDIQLKSIGK